MASAYVASLITARDNLANALAIATANPKPSYSVDDESYSWPEYYRFLAEQIENLTKLIAMADGGFDVAHTVSTRW